MYVRVSRTTSAKLSFDEPLAVVAQLRPLGIEDQERLLEIAAGVGVDLLVGEDRALGRAARRVADPGRVVADDQDADVPRVLERAHPLQRDRSADVDVGRGDVDAELHPQRPPERELLLEAALREQVDVIAGKGVDVAHGAVILRAHARGTTRWRKAASPASPASGRDAACDHERRRGRRAQRRAHHPAGRGSPPRARRPSGSP